MISCGKCGVQLVDGSLFCHMCGTKILYNDFACSYCGQILKGGSRFCGKCGKPVAQSQVSNSNPIRSQNTRVCPSCGAVLGSLDVACRACGAEVSNRNAPMSVNVFASELARIEAERPEVRNTGGLFQISDAEHEQRYGSKYLDRKISFIQSFPIPNTTEEIVEFILLAMSNIDIKYGNKVYDRHQWGKAGGPYYSEVKLASTWIGKLEQAYNKAKLLFPNDPMFPRIKEMYENKMREMDRL